MITELKLSFNKCLNTQASFTSWVSLFRATEWYLLYVLLEVL